MTGNREGVAVARELVFRLECNRLVRELIDKRMITHHDTNGAEIIDRAWSSVVVTSWINEILEDNGKSNDEGKLATEEHTTYGPLKPNTPAYTDSDQWSIAT